MMDQEQSVYIAGMTIAVIPPQATDSSSVDFFNHRSKSEYEYQSPNSGASGSPGLSSEGYPSSPDTPLDAFQPDLAHAIQTASSPYIDPLGLWESTSPSSLSPAFGSMNLAAENNNYVGSDFGNNTFGSDDISLKVDQAQQSRASLSPLTIPHNLNSPQPNQQLDSDEFFSQYLTPDIDAPSFDASSFDDMSLLGSLSVPDDSHLQRRPSTHARSNSAPFSGSVSPTVFLTPSEPNSSASLLLPHATFNTEDYCLADAANLSRRHSDTGVHGRTGFRGRSEGRSAPSSRGSSRGSSPYPRPAFPFESSGAGPALGPTGMSVSPSQIYDEMGQHLTVPHFEGGHHGHGHQRRHSFTVGVRPETMMMPGAMFEMDPFTNYGNGSGEAQSPMSGPLTPVSTPTTPLTPSRTIAQVASAAGISASERRRTKAAKFACPTCPQTFTTNHNLKNHINAHNGVKNHACEYCARAFTTASVLARHSKTCKSAPPH